MKTAVLLCLVALAVICEGQNYYHGRHSRHHGGRLHGGVIGRCPPRACTLNYIPDHCRKRNYFYHNGYRCKGCDIDICRGSIRGAIGEAADRLKYHW